MNDRNTADTYIDRVTNLPPAPVVVKELLEMFKEPDRDVDRIVQLMSYDPALTVEVLKRCNSAFFGSTEPVTDMFEAVLRLGFYEVYRLVVALVALRAMSLARSDSGLDAGKLWRHSVVTAVIAGILAQRLDEDHAAAFTAGLLHDVGKLILAAVEPAAYSELIKAAGNSGEEFAAKELEVLKVTHATVGARLLTRWGLDANVALAVSDHHEAPGAAPFSQRMTAIIALANAMAYQIIEETPVQGSPNAMEYLKLTPADLEEVVEATHEGLKRVQDLLHTTV